MESLQCISCNSPIPENALSCTKCGHVNKSMRTIAGKRFSGYREELYTRRVIKESRDEYLRMKRESRGIKTRLREKTKMSLSDLDLKAEQRSQLKDLTQLIGIDVETYLQTQPHTTPHCQYNEDNTDDENHVTHYVTKKKRRRRNRHVGKRAVKEHRTPVPTTPLYQFSMEGPLAEINKRLMNQSTFWMCLADWPL